MKKIMEYPAVFFTGGLGYGLLELIYRGHTHWTMPAAGGVCLLLIYLVSNNMKAKKWQKWVMGAFIISTVEFVTGGIVNILLGWKVWSYSHHRFNLMGQICPLFTLQWFLLCIPVVRLCMFIKRRVFSAQIEPEA
jgi:uncharacterized membrane protein